MSYSHIYILETYNSHQIPAQNTKVYLRDTVYENIYHRYYMYLYNVYICNNCNIYK